MLVNDVFGIFNNNIRNTLAIDIRKYDAKNRTFADLAVDFHMTVVHINDLFDQRQTQA